MPRLSSRSAFLATFGAGIAGLAAPRIALAQTQTLRISGVFSDLFGEPFYAQGAGAFAREGFAVDVTSLNNAGAVAAALGGGALDLGTGDLVSGVNAILAGVPLVLLAGGGLYQEAHQEQNILAVTNDSPIHVPTDLIGKKIGVPTLVGLTTVCLRKWLPDHGVPVDQAMLVEITQAETVPALQRGTIDCGLLGEPFITYGKGLVRSVGYPMNAVADMSPEKEFVLSVWYANENWVDADKDRARRAVRAIYDTARWANTHHAETFDLLVKYGHLDAARAAGMERSVYATSLTPELVQPVVTVAESEKVFNKPTTADALIAKL